MNDELRQRALRLLARREHSRMELERKLGRYGEPEEVEVVLNGLQELGILSDARFAESYIRSHATRFGVAKLRQTLRSKGVDAELINAQLAGADVGEELERARAIWLRKFAAAPVDAREWAKQARFLQSRGFDGDTIRRLLRNKEE